MKHFYLKRRVSFICVTLMMSIMTSFGQQNLDYLTDKSIVVAQDVVPDDWQDDLWVNKDFVELTVGASCEIWARRVPEIIDNPIANNVFIPDYNYVVVEGNSISVDANGVVTANIVGKSIVKVTYNGADAYGRHFGHVSRVNVAYVVVNVVNQEVEDVKISTDLSKTSYDTYYYTGANYQLPLSVESENATAIEVYCNGHKVVEESGAYLLMLENRANIIEVLASNGSKKRYWATVVDARKVDVSITNLSSQGKVVMLGDRVDLSFKGIKLPLPKVATFYNPCTSFGMPWDDGEKTKVVYTLNGNKEVKSNDPQLGQYALAHHNSIRFTLDKVGETKLTNGYIKEFWWGQPIGDDKNYKGKIGAGIGSPTRSADFSVMPEVVIDVVAPYQSATFEKVDLGPDGYTMVNLPEKNKEFSKVYHSGSYSFNLSATDYSTIFPVWSGTIVTDNSDNATVGGVENQLNSAAGGDVTGNGKYAVGFSAVSGGMAPAGSGDIEFALDVAHAPQIINGCYVTNNTYVVHSIENGDQHAKKFGGKGGNDSDWFLLTAQGLNLEGEVIATTTFYLADYRFEDNSKDYIVKDWQWFDLTSLGEVAKVRFRLTSSDVGAYGMNTPAYFCIDNIDEPRFQFVGDQEVVELNGQSQVIDLSTWFEDVNGTAFTTSVVSIPDGVVAQIDNNELTLTRSQKRAIEGELVVKAVCEKMSKTVSVTLRGGIASGMNDFTSGRSLNLFPNPTTRIINLEGVAPFVTHSYKIVDSQGTIAKQGVLDSRGQINVEELVSGIYFIVLDKELQYLKFIKE
ncbi:DUF4465 domain-containing protein [Prolixibacteraceae bacterium]|nr:DUF4465 domain-containing protein [Prolixibacteraceae bacterium]